MLRAFKQYDVRGIYPTEIDENLAFAAARAFQRFTGAGAFIVARDARGSSLPLHEAVVKALIGEGAHVLDLGLMPSPLVGFAMRHLKVPAGIMVSASHNPPAYNGLKLQILERNGFVIQVDRGAGLEIIEGIAEHLLTSRSFRAHFRQGRAENYDPTPEYFARLEQSGQGIAGLKVVADHGNGLGALTAEPLFRRLRLNSLHLFPDPDGNFPNHLADPHDVKNFAPLQRAVVEEGAAAGLFFDGDADRVLAVAETGRLVEADALLAILVRAELRRRRSGRPFIYHDLRASRLVAAAIRAAGGEPVALPVGNPFFKRRLAFEGGLMGGENSGHIMFAEHGGVDDGLFTAVKLLKILSLSGRPLSALAEPFWQVARIPEEAMPLGGEIELVFTRLTAAFGEAKPERLDGLTLSHPDWRLNVRPSNTEPVVRVNLEAKNEVLLKKIRRRLAAVLKP